VSEENPEKVTSEVTDTEGDSPSESFELSLSRSKNELIFKDAATGRTVRLHALSHDPETRRGAEPLTLDQFRDGLERLKALGLEWTGDRAPLLKAKDEESESSFYSPEYRKIQEDYPQLPREVAAVTVYALTGSPVPDSLAPLVGSKDDLEQKAAIVNELIVDADYSADFFFKHSVKVPYFSRIDWEVVFKTYEKNVDRPLAVPYALLSLELENPDSSEDEAVTVAVNLELLDELIESLKEVRLSLANTREIATIIFNALTKVEGKSDGAEEATEQHG
jgi:hypothetical protein